MEVVQVFTTPEGKSNSTWEAGFFCFVFPIFCVGNWKLFFGGGYPEHSMNCFFGCHLSQLLLDRPCSCWLARMEINMKHDFSTRLGTQTFKWFTIKLWDPSASVSDLLNGKICSIKSSDERRSFDIPSVIEKNDSAVKYFDPTSNRKLVLGELLWIPNPELRTLRTFSGGFPYYSRPCHLGFSQPAVWSLSFARAWRAPSDTAIAQ